MDDARIDRSTLKCWAWRSEKGIEVSANFSAGKMSGTRGDYSVMFRIDAQTKVATVMSFDLLNSAGGSAVFQNTHRLDRRRKMINEVRDVFMKSPAWILLKDRQPGREFIIRMDGNEVQGTEENKMTGEMTKESREWLEAECLRSAKKVPGCEGLERVVIERSEPGACAWRVDKFIPSLPPNEAREARLAVIKELTGKYLLMGE